VSRPRQLGRRLERIDEDEAVVGLDGDRAHVLPPLRVVGDPAPQSGRDLDEFHG
jgi:hypothetical protein